MPETILDHDEYNRRVRALLSGRPGAGAMPGGTPKLLNFLRRRRLGATPVQQAQAPEAMPEASTRPTEYPFIGGR